MVTQSLTDFQQDLAWPEWTKNLELDELSKRQAPVASVGHYFAYFEAYTELLENFDQSSLLS